MNTHINIKKHTSGHRDGTRNVQLVEGLAKIMICRLLRGNVEVVVYHVEISIRSSLQRAQQGPTFRDLSGVIGENANGTPDPPSSVVRYGVVVSPRRDHSGRRVPQVRIMYECAILRISRVDQTTHLNDHPPVLPIRDNRVERPILTIVRRGRRTIPDDVRVDYDGRVGRAEKDDVGSDHATRLGETDSHPSHGPDDDREMNHVAVDDVPEYGGAVVIVVVVGHVRVTGVGRRAAYDPVGVRRPLVGGDSWEVGCRIGDRAACAGGEEDQRAA